MAAEWYPTNRIRWKDGVLQQLHLQRNRTWDSVAALWYVQEETEWRDVPTENTQPTQETTPARSEAIQRRADAVANSCKVCGFMFGDHAPACSAVNTKVVTCEHVPRGYACEFCNHDGGPL
jgi:hypothetical protein